MDNQDAAYIAAVSPDVVLGLLAERDAFKADAAQLREALQDLYNDSIGFQDKSNWAMEKARAAIDMKRGEA